MMLYSDDVVFEDVSVSESLNGAAEMREFRESLCEAFPDLGVELRSLFGEETIAAAEYDLFGTPKGELDGHPPTESSFKVRALSVYEYDGDLFTRETFYWDSASMLQQLGLE